MQFINISNIWFLEWWNFVSSWTDFEELSWQLLRILCCDNRFIVQLHGEHHKSQRSKRFEQFCSLKNKISNDNWNFPKKLSQSKKSKVHTESLCQTKWKNLRRTRCRLNHGQCLVCMTFPLQIDTWFNRHFQQSLLIHAIRPQMQWCQWKQHNGS